MALTINTNIINDADNYSLDAKQVKGGFGVVSKYTDLAGLPAATIVHGSFYYAVLEEKFYQYNGNTWVEVEFGGGGDAGKYATTITGDGSSVWFPINHNLNTRELAVVVYDNTTYEQVLTNVTFVTENQVKITFATAPLTTESYRVICMIPQGPKGEKGKPGKVQDVKVNGTSVLDETTGIASLTVPTVDYPVTDVKMDGTTIISNKVANIPAASADTKGVMSAADFTKLSGISENAKNVSVAATGTSTSDVRYITIDGTESRFTAVALKAMKSAWKTGTTAAAATAILNDDAVIEGDGFLATVYWTDLPGEITQAEVKAFILKKGTGYQKILQFECTSGTVAPYSWFYNSYEGVWRSQVPIIDAVDNTSAVSALSANMGKNLQDQVNNLKNIGRFLAIWDSSTGLPLTNPTTMPYTYRTGDYYRVGTVASGSATNYKPNGATYDGTASTTIETESVEVGWVYYYDGNQWLAQSAGGGGLVQDVQVNGTTILDSGSGVANIPLASSSVNGAMSITQNDKLDGIAAGAQVNVLEGVKVNGTELTITDKKVNIPASIGVNSFGVMALANNSGLEVYNSAGYLHLANAQNEAITARKPQMQDGFGPITTNNFDFAVKAALTDGVGTTYTDSEKTAARTRIGASAPMVIEFLGDDE